MRLLRQLPSKHRQTPRLKKPESAKCPASLQSAKRMFSRIGPKHMEWCERRGKTHADIPSPDHGKGVVTIATPARKLLA
eukprot:1281211-Amphidinium_carterae.1